MFNNCLEIIHDFRCYMRLMDFFFLLYCHGLHSRIFRIHIHFLFINRKIHPKPKLSNLLLFHSRRYYSIFPRLKYNPQMHLSMCFQYRQLYYLTPIKHLTPTFFFSQSHNSKTCSINIFFIRKHSIFHTPSIRLHKSQKHFTLIPEHYKKLRVFRP